MEIQKTGESPLVFVQNLEPKFGLDHQISHVAETTLGCESDPYALDVKIWQKTLSQHPFQRATDEGCRQTDSGCYGTQSGCYGTQSGCYGTQSGC